ncbi:MAG: hypothetical protein U9N38_03475 [Thermodesulfobacteriota bacterium]|nr:hypothetical protein [Thermodesulfobacteriota bacterium]
MIELAIYIISAFLAAVGFFVVKFIIGPILEQKNQLMKIREFISLHSKVIAAPGVDNQDLRLEIAQEMKKLVSSLEAKNTDITWYHFLEIIGLVKKLRSIKIIQGKLLSLANFPFQEIGEGETHFQIIKTIKNELGMRI